MDEDGNWADLMNAQIEKENKAKYRAILQKAANIRYNSFVQSCAEFFRKNGFLTAKQIECLENQDDGVYFDQEDESYDDVHDFHKP